MILACGACTDAIMESRHWWIGAAPSLFVALLLEGAVFAVMTWRLKLASVAPRLLAIPIVGLIFFLAFFMGLATGLAVVTFVLLLAAGWSLFRNYRFSRGLTVARAVIITLGLAVGVWHAQPSQHSLQHLLGVAITGARFRLLESWVIDELRRRPAALPALEERVGESAEVSSLELHAVLGGAREYRERSCQRLREARPRDPEVLRVCAQ